MPVIQEHGGSFELEETFCKIETSLFVALVAIPLGDYQSELIEHMKDPKVGLVLYHVTPNSKYGVPVMISRDRNNTQYWDYPLESNGVRSSFLTAFWHNVKNEYLTLRLFFYKQITSRMQTMYGQASGSTN
jgi:hypothetical protein